MSQNDFQDLSGLYSGQRDDSGVRWDRCKHVPPPRKRPPRKRAQDCSLFAPAVPSYGPSCWMRPPRGSGKKLRRENKCCDQHESQPGTWFSEERKHPLDIHLQVNFGLGNYAI